MSHRETQNWKEEISNENETDVKNLMLKLVHSVFFVNSSADNIFFAEETEKISKHYLPVFPTNFVLYSGTPCIPNTLDILECRQPSKTAET